MNDAPSPPERIKVGISTCLLGVNVRFDGGHKRDAYVMGTLDEFFEWVPVCPEVEVGMGTPRESLRLVGTPDTPRMVTVRTGIDWTERMNRYADSRLRALAGQDLHGYILKSNSPSCGMERVRVYAEGGMPQKKGVGLFARKLVDALPYLPIEEEGRLNDPLLRENFVVRVFSHYRWHTLNQKPLRPSALVDFHARHKFLLMAHSEKHMRELGRVVADAKQYTPAALRDAYGSLFFAALAQRATRKRHVNVLQHIAGFFRKDLGTADRQELEQAIADYHQGLAPLIVPMTLIKLYARQTDASYIRNQVYLYPHPKELMLLNHV